MEGPGTPVLSLQWHQHPNTVVSLLDTLWERQELVDVTLAAEGKFVDVHRIVLCACSTYFQEILTNKRNTEKQTIIYLKDVSYSDLRALVDYMYKGEARIDSDQLQSFLDTAKSLGVRGLMSQENRSKKAAINKPPPSVEEITTSDLPPVKCELPVQDDPLNEASSMQPEFEDDEEFDLYPSTQNDDLNETNHVNSQLEEPAQQGDQQLATQDMRFGDQTMDWPTNSNQYNDTNSANSAAPQSVYRHRCPRCNRTYKWRQTMLRHMKYECGVEPQFICPICQAPFHYRNVLQRHINGHDRQK